MASNRPNQIYKPKRPVKAFFKVLGIVLLILVLLAVFIFFYFQRYIEVSGTEVRLDIPFLRFLYEHSAVAFGRVGRIQ